MARKRRPLVPGAQDALQQLKAQVMNTTSEQAKFKSAKEQNIPLTTGDNGNLTAREAGKVGGPIGGQMVKKLIALAQMQMINEQHRNENRPQP
ncbi:alpha/beta-type small acid-soluble spore protein [Tumebacillus flagellatus]|uniref:Alpha/beta hydrolase n=1 Tax=Tumebacillus flagellatus TaxID=1157490 RepID=A0A074MD11_9BACL|nr:alpha/beta-type small acid-soluble spore protein [Tumebacillus flagellatus]KEO83767.1 hypothetical protein EL26_07560 [Tumebacillus flagellatus]